MLPMSPFLEAVNADRRAAELQDRRWLQVPPSLTATDCCRTTPGCSDFVHASPAVWSQQAARAGSDDAGAPLLRVSPFATAADKKPDVRIAVSPDDHFHPLHTLASGGPHMCCAHPVCNSPVSCAFGAPCPAAALTRWSCCFLQPPSFRNILMLAVPMAFDLVSLAVAILAVDAAHEKSIEAPTNRPSMRRGQLHSTFLHACLWACCA
jgi:hypothetical protein